MREVNKEELIMRCFSCKHAGAETTDDVSFCNVCGEDCGCEDGKVWECYEPDDDCEDELTEEEAQEFIDWLYAENMPCDTYGMCSGTSCSRYFECHSK